MEKYIAFDNVVRLIQSIYDRENRLLRKMDRTVHLVPGYLHDTFEKALLAASLDTPTVTCTLPAGAFGHFDEKLVQTIPRHRLKGIDKLDVGMAFRTEGVNLARLVSFNDQTVVLDANHPWADKELYITADIKEIQPTATKYQRGIDKAIIL
ncbi:MAG: hypothetical protein H7A01_07075 [Hahellaceae bacterium]|nr:hypothetical protein [Hahellaceae bacterium]MCP5211723.1 hypothetical protein [Hahellaceae bacterium]